MNSYPIHVASAELRGYGWGSRMVVASILDVSDDEAWPADKQLCERSKLLKSKLCSLIMANHGGDTMEVVSVLVCRGTQRLFNSDGTKHPAPWSGVSTEISTAAGDQTASSIGGSVMRAPMSTINQMIPLGGDTQSAPFNARCNLRAPVFLQVLYIADAGANVLQMLAEDQKLGEDYCDAVLLSEEITGKPEAAEAAEHWFNVIDEAARALCAGGEDMARFLHSHGRATALKLEARDLHLLLLGERTLLAQEEVSARKPAEGEKNHNSILRAWADAYPLRKGYVGCASLILVAVAIFFCASLWWRQWKPLLRLEPAKDKSGPLSSMCQSLSFVFAVSSMLAASDGIVSMPLAQVATAIRHARGALLLASLLLACSLAFSGVALALAPV